MNQKNQNGITLIALVITIIVLLILAGVTINMVLGDDGIIAQASQAGKAQKEGSIEEEIQILKGEITIENHGGAKADLEDKNSDGQITAIDVIGRLEEKGITKQGELEEQGAYTIGYKDVANKTTYSLRGILKWDNSNKANLEINENNIVTRCEGYPTSVIVPEGVIAIDGHGFAGMTTLKGIEIPDTVTKLGSTEFSGCTSLTTIEIPDSVTSFDYATFSECASLRSIKIPGSIRQPGYETFKNCTSLADVEIEEGVTSIAPYMFLGCTSLTTIEIPASVTSIGENAFQGCTALTNIIIKGDALNSSSTNYPWGIDSSKAEDIIKFK